MYQGFYELTSGMLTQRRRLNVIADNMTNIETPGYKNDTQIDSTFAEEMVIRTGRTDRSGKTNLATATPIAHADETVTDYSQGTLEETDNVYDFAVTGDGFFKIDTGNGIQYTRNGQFSVADDGTLRLADIGNVLDVNNQPIVIADDNFTADNGVIRDADGNEIATIGVVDFADHAQLHKEDNGMYTTNQAEQAAPDDTVLQWKWLEKSNVNMVDEMTSMISSQRAFQSSAQLLKMYDSLMNHAVNDVGRVS